jgi:endonuclease-3
MPPRKPKPWSAHEIVEILDVFYGRAPHRPSGDPMAELVLTLLSQHTSDHNSGRAFHRLLERFANWDAVLAAPTSEVEDAIRPGGLAPTKAPRLQALVAAVRERTPDFDLSFLSELPLEEARGWLRSLPGVGPKTAACVLLFALGRPALPVDTHVDRVSRRLGLVAPKASTEQAHVLLEAMVPPEDVYAFHIDLIQHGRRTCHARGPVCEACPLLERCPRVGLPARGATTAAVPSRPRRATART